MRQDISLAQQLVQATHAAHESGLNNQQETNPSSIIIFGTKNKEELEQQFEKYKNHINCHPFYEPYKNIGLTAFATDPITESERHLFKSFKLWQPQAINPII